MFVSSFRAKHRSSWSQLNWSLGPSGLICQTSTFSSKPATYFKKSKWNGPVHVTSTGGCDASPNGESAAGLLCCLRLVAGEQATRVEVEPQPHVVEDLQRIDAGDLEAGTRLGCFFFQQSNLHFPPTTHVRPQPEADLAPSEQQLRVHFEIGSFDDEVVLRPFVAHVAADGDLAGEHAPLNLADLAALGTEVLVELQLGALRRFENDRIARRRDALLPRRGEHQQCKVR